MKFKGFDGEKLKVTKRRDSAGDHDHLELRNEHDEVLWYAHVSVNFIDVMPRKLKVKRGATSFIPLLEEAKNEH